MIFIKKIKIFFILLFTSKICFKNPPRAKIVVFDDHSMPHLKYLLEKYNYYVMQIRSENINKIYITFSVIKYFLKNYKGSIIDAYLLSLLEVINPKIVITFIDNSYKFSDLARIYSNKASFIAIQNSSRYELNLQNSFNKRFFLPIFFCFGQCEIDQYKKHKIEVKDFFKAGSLRLENFFHIAKKNKIQLKEDTHDICYSGEDMDDQFFGFLGIYGAKNIEYKYVQLAKYVIKFCIKHNMKLVTNVRTPEKIINGLHFYNKYLTADELSYLINSLDIKSENSAYERYKILAESKVVVGTQSTHLREKLAMGGKILSCNLTALEEVDFPNQGICSIKNFSYEEFESRLLKIYKMEKKNYFSELSKNKDYTMVNNMDNSAFPVIRHEIDRLLYTSN